MFASEKINYTVLVAPLDWGLGHATRCVPIINHFIQLGCKVVIATEGAQEMLLKTEFPHVEFVHLPGYRINYSNNKRFFALKIIQQLPKIYQAIKSEKQWLKSFISKHPVDAVISDNRYGLYVKQVPCVLITHQLTIKAPFLFAEALLQKISYRFIKNFSACWVPDCEGASNIAGQLSHPKHLPSTTVKYLGGLSRLTMQQNVKRQYDLLVIISGPEPQRSLLETKLLRELKLYKGKVLLLRGLPGGINDLRCDDNITMKNHLPAKELAEAFCNSDLIISRSGYTTVMDILKLGKKSVLIPTPGQTEQEYLAKHLEKQGWCVAAKQHDFELSKVLHRVQHFNYKFPQMNMESYKKTITSFVENL